MVAQILLSHILIDGGILTAIISTALVLMLYFKPRMALSDYPDDVRAAVPPHTKEELRAGILLSIPMLIIFVAIPLYSVWQVRSMVGNGFTYWMSFAIIFSEYFIVSMFDLIVLDLLVFYTWTPNFLVLPGTEGFTGYKDFRSHLKAQLITGNILIAGFAALLALIPIFFY